MSINERSSLLYFISSEASLLNSIILKLEHNIRRKEVLKGVIVDERVKKAHVVYTRRNG